MIHLIGDRANAWALDEARNLGGQDDLGVLVFVQTQPVQTPQGMVQLPAWFVCLTMRNPLLGHDPLMHCKPVCAGEPVEARIRAEVASGITQLRDLHRQQLSPANGASR